MSHTSPAIPVFPSAEARRACLFTVAHLILCLAVAGCAATMPKTPEEAAKSVNRTSNPDGTVLVVPRPYYVGNVGFVGFKALVGPKETKYWLQADAHPIQTTRDMIDRYAGKGFFFQAGGQELNFSPAYFIGFLREVEAAAKTMRR